MYIHSSSTMMMVLRLDHLRRQRPFGRCATGVDMLEGKRVRAAQQPVGGHTILVGEGGGCCLCRLRQQTPPNLAA